MPVDTQSRGEPWIPPGDVSPRPGELRQRGLSPWRAPTPPVLDGGCPLRRPGNGVSRANRCPQRCRIPPLQPPGGAPWLLPLWPGSGSLLPPRSSDGKAMRRSRISFAFSFWLCASSPRPNRAGSSLLRLLPSRRRCPGGVPPGLLGRRRWVGRNFPGGAGENLQDD